MPEDPVRALVLALLALTVGVLALAAWRAHHTEVALLPRVAPREDVVRVEGDVPHPGVYAIQDGTLGGLIARAGGVPGARLPEALHRRTVHVGDRIVVAATRRRICVEVEQMAPAEALLYGIPMDVNVATAADFEVLPGVGPAIAARIVAERSAHGPFARVDDLRRVRGVGPATVAAWDQAVRVRSSRPASAFPSPFCATE